MQNAIRSILANKTNWWHFSILLIVTLLVTAFIYLIIIPFTFWGMYGEGAASDKIYSQPLIDLALNWLALFISMVFLLFGYINNFRKGRLSNAKSYLMVAPLLFILYLLREPILDVMFRIFQ